MQIKKAIQILEEASYHLSEITNQNAQSIKSYNAMLEACEFIIKDYKNKNNWN